MEHLGVIFFRIAYWFYLAAAVCYLAQFAGRRESIGKAGTGLLLVGLALHTASIGLITAAIGRLPFLNMYEYLLMFTWGVAVLYAVTEKVARSRAYGSFVMPAAIVFLTFEYRLPTDIEHAVMPALQSAWRVPHIATAIMAYSAFLVAFVAAAMYLVRERSEGKPDSRWASQLPAAKVLDQTIYRIIAFGFLMQTLLLITGAIWAERAWGNYWSWDPKETWALITWLIYAAYLHTRVTLGWRGRRSAILALFGFAAVMVTLFAVTYLMGGLHSYAAN